MRLKDKAIIITGGTSGIGAAIATASIREGAKVLVHGINEEEGRATVGKLGANAVLCIADLAQDSAPKSIVDAAQLFRNSFVFPADSTSLGHLGTCIEWFDEHEDLRSARFAVLAQHAQA